MSSLILLLAGVGFIAVALTGILAVLIIGIRHGDRGRLTKRPDSHSDAFARHLLVGVRFPSESEKGEGQ